jgi:hypothetical protein
MTDFIWDRRTGEQLGWIVKKGDVFSVATKAKVATTRGRQLYSLNGTPMNLHLADLGPADVETPAAFRELLEQQSHRGGAGVSSIAAT